MNFAKNVTSMWDTHKKRLTWHTKEVKIKVVSRPTSRKEFEINLIDTLSQTSRPSSELGIYDCYWLSVDRFDRNDQEYRKDVLVPYFVNRCIEAGFNVMNKGWEKANKDDARGPNGEEPDGCVRMICNRGRYCQKKEEPAPATEAQVPDSTEDESGYFSESNQDYLCGECRPKVYLTPKNRVPRSYRPEKGKEELCPFKFNIYWSKEHQRW